MTSEAQQLINICQSYLIGQIDTEEYVDTFEENFWDIQEVLTATELEALDKISLENELYEPESSIRMEVGGLIDAIELRRRVQEHLDAMKDTGLTH